jgi:uncharacterized lipoprotein YehR (DUF1307 family)
MLLRKPSVAKGTKIVDKMLRQIDNEIALFEAIHAENVQNAEKMDAKYNAIYDKYAAIREHLWTFADKVDKAIDKTVDKLVSIGSKKMEAATAKKADLIATNVEHTADINKLTRIRDKVATLAD